MKLIPDWPGAHHLILGNIRGETGAVGVLNSRQAYPLLTGRHMGKGLRVCVWGGKDKVVV
jgi:hypothetical protein